jgi:two-component system nitrogen regulation response regulator NtrX
MKILLVDDEKNILESISRALSRMGYQVLTAADASEAERLCDQSVETALIDVWLGNDDGVELLKRLKSKYPELIAVMISGHSTIATAVKAIKFGAYDFLEKPLSLDKLDVLFLNIDELLSLRRQRDDLLARLDGDYKLIGESPAVEDLLQLIERYAPEEASVLITGESGSGKELVARMVHSHSPRAKGPFVALNCAALPAELAEAELFGYDKGAFTGAMKAHDGHFRRASGGVLFLDEISEMSLPLQAKLLRVIEDKKVTPLGGKNTHDVDFRLVAASNRQLKDEVGKGKFRQDLFFRLNVLPVSVPPLRERVGDIRLLVEYFCSQYAQKTNKKIRKMALSGIAILEKLNYPGNIRELKNYIERILIVSDSDPIEAADVKIVLSPVVEADFGVPSTLKQAVDDFEREYILKTIRGANDNMAKAARSLGLERSHLYKKLKSLGIDKSDNGII